MKSNVEEKSLQEEEEQEDTMKVQMMVWLKAQMNMDKMGEKATKNIQKETDAVDNPWKKGYLRRRRLKETIDQISGQCRCSL